MTDISPPLAAKGIVHKMVAEHAKAACRGLYQEAARDNAFYKLWPNEEEFVALRWQSFIQTARQFLASLLQPHFNLSEDDKAKIHEALLLNAAVNPAINSVKALNS